MIHLVFRWDEGVVVLTCRVPARIPRWCLPGRLHPGMAQWWALPPYSDYRGVCCTKNLTRCVRGWSCMQSGLIVSQGTGVAPGHPRAIRRQRLRRSRLTDRESYKQRHHPRSVRRLALWHLSSSIVHHPSRTAFEKTGPSSPVPCPACSRLWGHGKATKPPSRPSVRMTGYDVGFLVPSHPQRPQRRRPRRLPISNLSLCVSVMAGSWRCHAPETC